MAVGWTLPLTQTLVLKDGTRLAVLWDAAELMTRRFGTITQSAAVEYAVRLLLRVAETGTEEDRKAATDQIVLVLRLDRMM
jgi:hypothetical protein